jgi:hypothetical protein
MENIAVVKAPCLERLILHGSYKRGGGLCTRVRIGDAPKLHAFGYLKPDQVLEIRDTIIMVRLLLPQSFLFFSSVSNGVQR